MKKLIDKSLILKVSNFREYHQRSKRRSSELYSRINLDQLRGFGFLSLTTGDLTRAMQSLFSSKKRALNELLRSRMSQLISPLSRSMRHTRLLPDFSSVSVCRIVTLRVVVAIEMTIVVVIGMTIAEAIGTTSVEVIEMITRAVEEVVAADATIMGANLKHSKETEKFTSELKI